MAFVIGTAGHIDHGKTSLVKLLTGQDTDQLRAEKERGISIDLGFAHFELADGRSVGIVDVPGHEKFIRNMVAGVHGIDLVLFVVAADDGVMPQTEEHFDIVRSLGVEQAIFIITKSDLADADRIADVVEEIEILVDGSAIEGSPILPVSNVTGAGIDHLTTLMAKTLDAVTVPAIKRPFRMPIDRVFSIHGRGVVITGTALSGSLQSSGEIAIMPGGSVFRLRGLQSHGEMVDVGHGGERLAINIMGAERQALRRGDVACDPAIARATERFDVQVTIAAHAVKHLKNGQRVRLHMGTAERHGAVILLGEEKELVRGGSGIAQITVSEPLQAMAGDRFVIRDEQAEHTLGGGKVLDPIGVKDRRSDNRRLARLASLDTENGVIAAEALIDGAPSVGVTIRDLAFRMNMHESEVLALAAKSIDLTTIDAGETVWIASVGNLDGLDQAIAASLRSFHQDNPSMPGLGLEELRGSVGDGIDPRLFREVIDRNVAADRIARDGAILALAEHQAGLTKTQEAWAETFMTSLQGEPFAPPAPDTTNSDEQTIIAHLERAGQLIRTTHGLIFSATAFAEAERRLEDYLTANSEITASEFRNILGTTRKFALALLETFDKTGLTVRIGDKRKLGRPAMSVDQ